MQQIVHAEPRPPRQIDDTIPRELERICLKALAKRASERYSTARDLAEDLRHFLETASGGVPPTPGLGCRPPGDGGHADAARIGGPIRAGVRSGSSRKGLGRSTSTTPTSSSSCSPARGTATACPDGLRFWKTRIESADPDRPSASG